MPLNLKGKSLLTLLEYSAAEIDMLISSAIELKQLKRQRIFPKNLANRNFALIFDKPSCRTRASFVVAASDEGAHLEIFNREDIRFGIKESVRDVARVFGRMFDGIAYRGNHAIAEELSEYSGVPVWNGLSELYHPTQVLADLMTIKEKFGKYEGIKMAYIGDGRNNMGNSLIIGCLKMGMELRIVAPQALMPSEQTIALLTAECRKKESILKGRAILTNNIALGLQDCDVVYGDVWVSMGEEDFMEERIRLLKDYRVTPELMSLTGNVGTIYLHCLPAFHDDQTEVGKKYPEIREVSDEVFESPQNLAFEQAENRMHTIKAVMAATV